MSFFETLRKGVENIESEVKKLKQMTETGGQRSDNQLIEDLNKAKRFDAEVRKTYIDTTQLYGQLKSPQMPLIESKNKIKSIKAMLFDIENSSELKNYGYKPFAEQYSDSSDDNIETIDDNNSEQPLVYECADIPEPNDENVIDSKDLLEEFTQRTNGSEERTERTAQTRRFIPDLTSGVQQMDNRFADENSTRGMTKKYDKLLIRTPQPYDFGITRRFTLLPHKYNINTNNKTPEEPNFESTNTCRFNYFSNNGLNLGSDVNQLTPPNVSSNSVNNADSFVTVEFTPGLTTKRPKGISRVNANNCNNFNAKEQKSVPESTQRFPKTIFEAVENDRITPEQPIPSGNGHKSAKILQSIVGNSSGTPPLPKTRVNSNFHNQILKHL